MGSLHQICLRWNNHQSNFPSVFNKLLNNKDFVDVTLSCEGQTVKAHKIVLSACSPYFHTLFLDNPCKHPIVILKDVRYLDLKCIVEYVYKGEVSIGREQLSEFLRTAQALQIKGLSADDNDSVPPSPVVQSGASLNESAFHAGDSQTTNNYQHNAGYSIENYKMQQSPAHAPHQLISSKHKESSSKILRPSSGSLPAAKMPRLSAAPWKEKVASTPSPPAKKPEVPVTEITPVPSAIDTQETTHIVTEPDYSVEGEMDREAVDGDDALSITVPDEDDDVMVKYEAGQESPGGDDDVPYERYSADPKLLRDLEASVGLSDASDSGDVNLDSTSQDPGGGPSFSGAGSSQGSSSTGFLGLKSFRGLQPYYKTWTRTELEEAIREVLVRGLAASPVARRYGIPARTLQWHVRKRKTDLAQVPSQTELAHVSQNGSPCAANSP